MAQLGLVVGALIGGFVAWRLLRGSRSVSHTKIMLVVLLGGLAPIAWLIDREDVRAFERSYRRGCLQTCAERQNGTNCGRYCDCGLLVVYDGRKRTQVVAAYRRAFRSGKRAPPGELERIEAALPACQE